MLVPLMKHLLWKWNTTIDRCPCRGTHEENYGSWFRFFVIAVSQQHSTLRNFLLDCWHHCQLNNACFGEMCPLYFALWKENVIFPFVFAYWLSKSISEQLVTKVQIWFTLFSLFIRVVPKKNINRDKNLSSKKTRKKRHRTGWCCSKNNDARILIYLF